MFVGIDFWNVNRGVFWHYFFGIRFHENCPQKKSTNVLIELTIYTFQFMAMLMGLILPFLAISEAVFELITPENEKEICCSEI